MPVTIPASTPSDNVRTIVAAIAVKSALEYSHVRFSAPRSTKDKTATIMVAAKVAFGN